MSWEERRIEHLADEVRDTVDPGAFGDAEVDHYSIPALDATGKPETQPASQIQSHKQWLRGGEVLLSRLNPRKARVLRVPPLTERVALASSEFVVLRPHSVAPRFLEYLLLSEETRQTLDGAVQSVTRSHQRIRPEQLLKLRVAVPTERRRQRAIADFLDTETARIDALMDKKRRLAEALLDRFTEEVRRTVLLNATYSDPLQLSSLDVPSSDVRAMRLSWIARFGSGTTPVAGAGHYYGGDIPWVLTGDLTDGEVRTTTRSVTDQALMDYSALKVHPAESLVVAMYGATIGKLGILKVDAAVNQACCVISAGCNLDTEFLYFYLLGFRQELIDRGRGSGQPNISQEILRSLRIAIPSMDTQREVVASLKQKRARVWRLITAIDWQVRLLLERRQALITAAVTGELEVPGVAA